MQRTDGQPKRRKLLQNHRTPATIRAIFAELRKARAERKERWAATDPDVQNYRLEKELAVTRWTIDALNADVPDTERCA